MSRPVLFIQGGGADVHDQWDDKLVASLSRALGTGWEVRYPRLPDEADPSFAKWAPAIRAEIADLDEGAAIVGHSIGGTMLVAALAEEAPQVPLAAIMLAGAPFVGEGGWPGEEFELPGNLGAKLPKGVPVHVFHGLADDTAPPDHADLWARAIPPAEVHRLPGRDHQLNNDLGEVAGVIRGLGSK